jgi:hypothetical protein
MRGVPGGAGVRENSAAREVRGVCFVERAMSRLVLRLRRETRDWGVMSFAKAGKSGFKLTSGEWQRYYAHLVSEAKRMTCEKLGTSSSMRTGDSSRGDLNVNSNPRSVARTNFCQCFNITTTRTYPGVR